MADRDVDVVVVGSGAAGMTAALVAADAGCAVRILEKGQLVGGTTAVSGGGIWVPMNPHMAELGISDSRAEALAYLKGLTLERQMDQDLVELYVDEMRTATEYLEAATPLQLSACAGFSDYFADRPGGKPMGRTLHPLPYPARAELGRWDELLRESPHFMRITVEEWASARADPLLDLAALASEWMGSGTRTLGGALSACLLRGLLDRDVPLELDVRATELIVDEGAVVGVVAERDGERAEIRARRGVVLATGGFEWNQELVQAFVGVPDLRATTPPTNEGDGLVMALRAGAAVANLTVTWGYPVSWDGHSTYDGHPLYLLRSPYREPGTIIVNRRGHRFASEGVSYMDFPKTHRTYDPVALEYPNEPPVWEIFDRRVRDRMTLGDLRPGEPTPDWVIEAASIPELADAIGVDPGSLVDEVERFNEHVAAGADPDFGRGTVWFEGYLSGGPRGAGALAPIDEPPYYALAVYDGATGTAGGVRIDRCARVLTMEGGVIPGLYAAGNTAASVFGPSYPAGGAILGQAILFGYLAGRDLATEARVTA